MRIATQKCADNPLVPYPEKTHLYQGAPLEKVSREQNSRVRMLRPGSSQFRVRAIGTLSPSVLLLVLTVDFQHCSLCTAL